MRKQSKLLAKLLQEVTDNIGFVKKKESAHVIRYNYLEES